MNGNVSANIPTKEQFITRQATKGQFLQTKVKIFLLVMLITRESKDKKAICPSYTQC